MAINYETFGDGGLKYALLKLKEKLTTMLANKVNKTDIASDSAAGIIKTDILSNIIVDENGVLRIGGRLGETASGGLYYPITLQDVSVDARAILLTGMSGVKVANGTLALLRGSNVTVKQAAAGATEYRISNTYLNRLATAGLQASGAVCILNEAAEASGYYSRILSCTINGAAFTPTSEADDPNNDIVITVDRTANPDAATTSLRCYPVADKSSSFFSGQMVGGYNGLANAVIGQQAFSNGGNVVCMVAAQSYNTGNGNGIFGRYHNSRKNRWFLSGTGHDNTNGRAEAGAAVGQYSVIEPDTLFAVGNGTDNLNRYNAFEVKEGGVSLPSANYIEIKDTNLAPALNTTNYSKTAAITIDGDIAIFPDSTTALHLTKKSPAIPVTEGEVLSWSFEVRKTADDVACNFGLNLLKTNATGGSASNNWVKNSEASEYTTEWQTISGEFTVPSGMAYMTPRMSKTMPSGGTATSGAYEARNLVIKRHNGALVLSSPNGTKYKISVADDGTLSTVAI